MVQIVLMEEADKDSLSLDFHIFSGNRNTVGEKSLLKTNGIKFWIVS